MNNLVTGFFRKKILGIDTKKLLTILVDVFLLAWTVFNFLMRNQLFAFFCFALFLFFQIMRSKPYSVLAGTLIVIIIFNTRCPFAWNDIIISNLDVIVRPSFFVKNLFSANTGIGENTVDKKIVWMLSVINNNQFDNYNLSDSLDQDGEINQRIVETTWPLKQDKDSKIIFLRPEEMINYSSCDLIDQKWEIIVVHCP